MYKQLDDFIFYLSDKEGKSRNTCLSYQRDLRQMMDYLSSAFGISKVTEITGSYLSEYEQVLKDKQKSPATISRYVASAKAFFEYELSKGFVSTNPTKELNSPKVIKKKPSILSEVETVRLLSMPGDDPKGMRDKAMLELMCDTGMRVSELLGIKLTDIDIEKRTIVVPGSRTRKIGYDRKINKYLDAYIKNARAVILGDCKDDGFLFLNVNGEGMSRQGFWKLIKKYGKAAEIETELTPHVLRHSFAAHALKNGKDIKKVQSIMGHSDLSTTSGYLSLY
ncbi:MAG: tyrosine-type recombinase/integrase [Eubacteriales bacterium]|nr:tyrosine-type recombinase/integrase [Eubacteriales bacterium]